MSRSGIIPVSSSDPQPPTPDPRPLTSDPQPPAPNPRPLLAYFLLTIVMTWPTILHLTDGIPGDGFDGWQNYWNMWWVKKALLELGTTPFFTDYLYPPNGASLLFHTLNIFNSFWTLPIQLNFGLAIAYNSVVLVSFTLAGYGGYLLSLYTLARLGYPASGLRAAAFVGGLVFTMSPFHMAHLLGHMQVFSMIWPPFYVLWLLRTLHPLLPNAETEESFGFKRVILSDEGAKNLLRRPQIRGKVTFHGDSSASPQNDIFEKVPGFCAKKRRGEVRNVALTCLFLILATLVDWYHTLYLLIFTGLTLLWVLWRNIRHGSKGLPSTEHPTGEQGSSIITHYALRPTLRPVWLVLAIGLGFGIVLSPLLIPMIRAARSIPQLQTSLDQSITLSADLLAFVLPSEMHPIWGEWAKSIANNFSSTLSERLVFAGFVPLALALFALIRGCRHVVVKFWTFITAAFFILSLGPYLHIGGKIAAIGGWPVPLPYLLLYNIIPFIGLTRSLSRYDLMVMLGLGVLAAIGIAALTGDRRPETNDQRPTNLKSKTDNPLPPTPHASRFTFHVSRFTLALLATLLICFEFLAIPYPISKIDTPQFYFDLARQPGDFTIAELPMNWDRPTPMLYQTVHGKRLLTAYTSRDNPLELAWRTPVLQHWRYLGPDIIDQPLNVIAPTIFYDFNLRYIVLDYYQMPPGPEREATERWVAAALPEAAPVYDDGRLKVFQAPSKQETQPYLSLGDGWGKRQENDDGSVTRAFAAPAELFLHHSQNQALVLEITAKAQAVQELTVSANDTPVTQIEVGPTVTTQALTLPPFSGDLIKLTLSSERSAGTVTVSRVALKMNE